LHDAPQGRCNDRGVGSRHLAHEAEEETLNAPDESTLVDEEIETTPLGNATPTASDDTGDDSDGAGDTGDDSGDPSDAADTGDDSGDATDGDSDTDSGA
jgi:hypothetical protein